LNFRDEKWRNVKDPQISQESYLDIDFWLGVLSNPGRVYGVTDWEIDNPPTDFMYIQAEFSKFLTWQDEGGV
jgi:hypothetical protein